MVFILCALGLVITFAVTGMEYNVWPVILFVLVPAIAMSYDRGCSINRRRGTVRLWTKVLFWIRIRHEVRPLDAYRRVLIDRIEPDRKGEQALRYRVRLEGERAPVLLSETDAPMKAIAAAEEVAKFLAIELADRSSGAVVVRKASDLDTPLRQRAADAGRRLEALPGPPPDRLTCDSREGRLRVVIPRRGFRLWQIMAMLFAIPAMISFGVAVSAVLGNEEVPPWMRWVFGVGPLAILGLLGAAMYFGKVWPAAMARVIVEVTPELLRVTRRGPGWFSSSEIPLSELEELRFEVPAGRSGSSAHAEHLLTDAGILARSDRAAMAFGHGLAPQELHWLKAAIEKAVTGQPPDLDRSGPVG